MTFFSQFSFVMGALCALMVMIACVLFRTAAAPMWAKISVPIIMVSLALYAPYSVNRLLGFPITVSLSTLPQSFELVAFEPMDDNGTVDLWIMEGEHPRSFEIALDGEMKKTLRAAKENGLNEGRHVLLSRDKRSLVQKVAGYRDGQDAPRYIVDPSVSTALPTKGGN